MGRIPLVRRGSRKRVQALHLQAVKGIIIAIFVLVALTTALRHWVDFNLDLDNVTNKAYYEPQIFFESRASPSSPSINRIHGHRDIRRTMVAAPQPINRH